MLTKEQLEKMAKNYGQEVLEIDIPAIKAAKTALIYMKALELACVEIASFDICPLDLATKEFAEKIAQICLSNETCLQDGYDIDAKKCLKEYFLMKARDCRD
jgi:hypothetical protein